MEPSRWRPSPGTVFGLLALVITAAGTAIAGPLATTSVLSKKEKNQVKRIAKSQINKLAPGLAVASASRANAADTAGNASLLDGLDASAFTPADQIHNSGRVVVNDSTPGDDLSTFVFAVFTVGPFTVQASCAENFNGGIVEQGNLSLTLGPSGSSFSGTRSDGVDLNTVDATGASIAFVSNSANQVKAGHITAVAPNGQVVSVSGSVEVNDPAGDCVFGATAIGP